MKKMKIGLIFLVLLLHVQKAFFWSFKSYPYADLSLKGKLTVDGYPFEMHEVTTEDNYILTLYRIPYGKCSSNLTFRSPVLLSHGMGASPEMYVVLGKDRALPYILADGGFDVWLMSARGTHGSRRHKYYDLNVDRDYWNFGLHEIAIYDIPANIDYIVKKTEQKVFIIGHSQGNTCHFITTTEREEYNDKIKMAVLYAPTLYLNYIDIPMVHLVSHIIEIVGVLYDLLDLHEAIPFMDVISGIGKRLCREQTYVLKFCFHILSVIGSHESRIVDKDLLPVITSTPLPRFSSMQLFHYMQMVKSGKFKQYDYGVKKNLQVYGRESPPEYDLKKSTTPLAIFYAPRDDLVTIKAAEKAIKTFPNVIYHHLVDYKHFTHIDFLFGKNTSDLVYQKTVQLLKDFDDGILLVNGTKMNKTIKNATS